MISFQLVEKYFELCCCCFCSDCFLVGSFFMIKKRERKKPESDLGEIDIYAKVISQFFWDLSRESICIFRGKVGGTG